MTRHWSFDGENLLRHGEVGAVIYHPNVVRAHLKLMERQGPWAAEHVRQMREALAQYDTAIPDETEAAIWAARMEHA